MPANELQVATWIEHADGVCGGEARIRKTRHTVAGLIQWRSIGLSDDRILEIHPDLTHEDLSAAWAYYGEHRAEIDLAIRADEDA